MVLADVESLIDVCKICMAKGEEKGTDDVDWEGSGTGRVSYLRHKALMFIRRDLTCNSVLCTADSCRVGSEKFEIRNF